MNKIINKNEYLQVSSNTNKKYNIKKIGQTI